MIRQGDICEYAEYVEPFGPDQKGLMVCRVPREDVINLYRQRPEYKDATDEVLFDEFVTVHWATVKTGPI